MSSKVDVGSVVRWSVIILIAGSLVAMVIYGIANKPPKDTSAKVWNSAMTKGNTKAENHFVEYTDMVCPYCAKFALAMQSGLDELGRDFFDNNKVLFELRLADIISDHNVNGVRANESGYCAAKQDKFWPYYEAMQKSLTADFYDKGIANMKGAPEMPQLEDDYYHAQAEAAGLDQDDFKRCLASGAAKSELDKATEKARLVIQSGVPYFVFNSFTSSGFDGDFKTVRRMFEAGLDKK